MAGGEEALGLIDPELRDQVASAIEATCNGRFPVVLIVRDQAEQGRAGYLLGIYGGTLAALVTVMTRAEAGPEWHRLTQRYP